MSLADLTSPTAVKLAIQECDRLGRDEFLRASIRPKLTFVAFSLDDKPRICNEDRPDPVRRSTRDRLHPKRVGLEAYIREHTICYLDLDAYFIREHAICYQ